MLKQFKLIKKNQLTHDVFELVFEFSDTKTEYFYWQFITFILPWIWWRAYSILDIYDNNKIVLIIKRIENWRWWSKFICDSSIWDIFTWVWPAWYFKLQENNSNKLFLWTWVWFVPLYNQIIWSINLKQNCKLKLIFWVSDSRDIFYYEKLENIKNNFSNFDFDYCLSKEKKDWFNNWRITNFIDKKYIQDFEEFYICWNPAMINDVKSILENLWIQKNKIFYEWY